MMGFKTSFSLFCDCWQLYSKYAVSNLGEEEMQKLTEQDIQVLYYGKYKKEPLAKDMIMAVMSEIDRIEKVKKR